MANQVSMQRGSLNMPKMLRHLSHRTQQIKSLTFLRPALHPKSSKATGQSSSTKGSGSSLAGPAVNFGYEKNSSTDSVLTPTGDNTFYHSSPEILIPEAFEMLQQPIQSRGGGLSRSGNSQSGRCRFYGPTWASILQSRGPLSHGYPNLPDPQTNIEYGTAFPNMEMFQRGPILSELEVDDILMERDIGFDVWGGYEQSSYEQTAGWTEAAHNTDVTTDTQCVFTFPTRRTGLFHVDRFQFKVQGRHFSGNKKLLSIVISVDDADGDIATLTYTLGGSGLHLGTMRDTAPTQDNKYNIIDLPIRDVKHGDTPTVIGEYPEIPGGATPYATVSIVGDWESDKTYGPTYSSSRGQLNTVTFNFSSSSSGTEGVRIWDFYFYKGLKWSVDSIKEYSGEYLQIECSMVRGVLKDSIKRAYG